GRGGGEAGQQGGGRAGGKVRRERDAARRGACVQRQQRRRHLAAAHDGGRPDGGCARGDPGRGGDVGYRAQRQRRGRGQDDPLIGTHGEPRLIRDRPLPAGLLRGRDHRRGDSHGGGQGGAG